MTTTRDGWLESPLQQLTSLIRDGTHGTHADAPGGVPLLSAKDVRDGRLDIPEDCRLISESDYALLHKNYQLQDDDVLLTIVGSIGRCCLVPKDAPRFTFQRSVAVVRASKVKPSYLYQYFRGWEFQRSLDDVTNASAQGGVYLGALAKLLVSYPIAYAEQSKIADVLSTVDRVIAQTEALMAKQQRIKTGLMQDLLTRGIGEDGQLRSEGTYAPMVPLSELAEINPPRQKMGISGATPVSFIPMSDVSESGRWTAHQVRPYSQVASGYTRFLEGDVLFAKITPCMENGKGCHAIGSVNGLGFASTEFHVLRAKQDSDARFIFQWTLDHSFRLKAASRMTGSAGQQRVPASFFDNFLVPRFTGFEQSRIADVLSGADQAIEQNLEELTKLRHIRIALMRDLLTGKVRVTPLLQQAEEADSA